MPELTHHSSIFIYPIYFNIPQKDVTAKIGESSSWVLSQVDSKSNEYIFFTETARTSLFKYRYSLNNLEQVKISYKGIPHQLNSVSLTLMPRNIAILSFDINFPSSLLTKTDRYTIGNLLDFNENFRYIADIYKSHRESRKGLVIESSFLNIEQGVTEDLIDALINPIFNKNGISQYKGLFDERMITFSIAYLSEKPMDDIAYKFFNIDSSHMELPDKVHMISFLKDNTYKRWRDKGILYGFTHYSGGCLVWDKDKGWLMDIFKKQYADLSIILYFLFGSLKLFDSAISSTNIRNKKRFLELEEQFIEFVKDYWFADFTNQDQGRELFRLWRSTIEKEYNLWERVNYKIKLWREMKA